MKRQCRYKPRTRHDNITYIFVGKLHLTIQDYLLKSIGWNGYGVWCQCNRKATKILAPTSYA